MVSGGSRGEDDGMLLPSGMQQFLVREKYRQSMTYLALRLKCYNHAEAIFALKFVSV